MAGELAGSNRLAVNQGMWIFDFRRESLDAMKPHTDPFDGGFEGGRVVAAADVNPVAHAGRLSTIQIAVESIAPAMKSGGRQTSIQLPHQAGFEFGESYTPCHDERPA